VVRAPLLAVTFLASVGACYSQSSADPEYEIVDGGGPGDEDAGEVVCTGGQTNCGGTCVDVATDGRHCGRCAHNCFGAPCTAGLCAPKELAAANIPHGIVVDTQDVYVAVSGENRLGRLPKVGGTIETLSSATTYPWGLALVRDANGRASRIVWGEARAGGGIHTCDAASCASTMQSAPAIGDVRHVATTGAQSFFAITSAGEIRRCDTASCSTTLSAILPAEPDAYGIAIAGTALVYGRRATAGKVRRATTAGVGPADAIATIEGPEGIATDGTDIYATADDRIVKCALTGCPGGAASFAMATNPHDVAVDEANVYWTVGLANGGSVNWCPKTGCPAEGPRLLAADQKNPYHLAVDDRAVYWTNATPSGGVMTIAKP
jgi:DNA-binding beta-propeller fold protein YncE